MKNPFNLINSLINTPPTIIESEMQAAPQAPSGERLAVIDFDPRSKLTEKSPGTGTVSIECAADYFNPEMDFDGEDALHVAIDLVLECEFTTDDRSFDHHFGYERDVVELLEEVKFTSVVFPHDQSNYALLKLAPEHAKRAVEFIKEYFTSMEEEEIGKLLDLEKLQSNANRYDPT